jgi:hypothetical protein
MVSANLPAASPLGRIGRAVLAASLVVTLLVGTTGVEADSEGGQAGSYVAPEQSINLCTGWEPEFVNSIARGGRSGAVSAIAINNPTAATQTIEFRFRRVGGETLSRQKAVAPGSTLYFSFGQDSPTPTATTTPLNTPVPAPTTPPTLTVNPTSQPPTPVPTNTLLPTATATLAPLGTQVPQPTDAFFALPVGFTGTVTASGCNRDVSATIIYGTIAGAGFSAFEVESSPACTIWSPLFMNNVEGWTSTVSLFNETNRQSRVEVRLKGLNPDGSEGALLTRSLDLSSRSTRTLTPSDLSVPENFSGSIQASACPSLEARTLGSQTTAELAALAVNAGEISGVVVHDKSGADRMVTNMSSLMTAASELFFPLVYNDYNGWTSRVILFNSDKAANPLLDRDIVVTVKVFVTEAADESATRYVERSLIIRAESPRELDMMQLPKGVMSILVEPPELVQPAIRFVGASYHLGPNGAAGAQPGQASESRAQNQFELGKNFFPLLYRHAGFEDAWDSGIRVVKTGDGTVTPRITFYDRDSGEQIGPIPADRTLREGEAYTWYLPAIEALRDGRIYSADVEGGIDDRDAQMVSVVHHFNRVRGLSSISSGFVLPGLTQFRNIDRTAPLLYRNVDGLNSGIQIQNLAGGDESATVRFRNLNGTDIATVNLGLRSHGAVTVYLPAVANLPDGFIGAAEILGTGPIGVEVNTIRYR